MVILVTIVYKQTTKCFNLEQQLADLRLLNEKQIAQLKIQLAINHFVALRENTSQANTRQMFKILKEILEQMKGDPPPQEDLFRQIKNNPQVWLFRVNRDGLDNTSKSYARLVHQFMQMVENDLTPAEASVTDIALLINAIGAELKAGR